VLQIASTAIVQVLAVIFLLYDVSVSWNEQVKVTHG
jgi:hypothetical protein